MLSRTRYTLDKNGNVVAIPLPPPIFTTPAPVDPTPRDETGRAIGNYL